MRYCKDYEILPEFVSDGVIKWRTTGCGEYVLAQSGGKTLFVKRNMHVRYPAATLPPKVFEKYKAAAVAIQHKQEKLRALMSGLDWERDHIVGEIANFWDSENMFVTVTQCVPNAMADQENLSALSLERFLSVAIETSEAVAKLHLRGVIHGDLKPKNIVLAKKGTKISPYIIDFDSAYPADEIPDSEGIGGSEGYQSPENILYGSEEGAAPRSVITYATDVFSLGIIFHKWWANAFPTVAERCSVGEALCFDKTFSLNAKFNVKIGAKNGATLISLINWMLAKDPAKRPTAQEVTEVLKDMRFVPEEYRIGGDDKQFEAKLWDLHEASAELPNSDKLKALGVTGFGLVDEKRGGAGLKYRVVKNDGTERLYTIDELCAAGYAVKKGASTDTPWDDDDIEFESAEVIAAKGYTRIQKIKTGFRKRYLVTMVSGGTVDVSADWLVREGLARRKAAALPSIDMDTPWPEHGSAYLVDNMKLLGIIGISRVEFNGEHRYRIVYAQMVGGVNKVHDRVPASNVKLLGLIK